jgi:uncharacterized MAPEG superfamily protein
MGRPIIFLGTYISGHAFFTLASMHGAWLIRSLVWNVATVGILMILLAPWIPNS